MVASIQNNSIEPRHHHLFLLATNGATRTIPLLRGNRMLPLVILVLAAGVS